MPAASISAPGPFSWTGATFDSFSESGVSRDQRLRFSGSNADLFGTELAIKIGVPLRSDERSSSSSLRLGWIANWGQDNGNQTVRYIESGDSLYGMSTENANGLLVEAGLDFLQLHRHLRRRVRAWRPGVLGTISAQAGAPGAA